MNSAVKMEWSERPAFEVIGLKWSGTFAEAASGAVRDLQAELQKRAGEIEGAEAPDELLGLSYEASPEGFEHYAGLRVRPGSAVPAGMVKRFVPAQRYAECAHSPEEAIEASYHRIYDWIAQNGAEADAVEGLTHFEIYPFKQDPYAENPSFRILIPVKIVP